MAFGRQLILGSLGLVLSLFSRLAMAQNTLSVPTDTPPSTASEPNPSPSVTPAPHTTDAERDHQKRYWYGDQILIGDAASVSIAALGFALGPSRGNGLVGVGVVGYALVPPILHVTHGRWGIAPASMALRVFTPALGLLVGNAAGHCPAVQGDGDSGDGLVICDRNSAALGALGAALFVTAIDSLLFSWERRRVDTTESNTVARVGFAPLVSAARKYAEIRAYVTF